MAASSFPVYKWILPASRYPRYYIQQMAEDIKMLRDFQSKGGFAANAKRTDAERKKYGSKGATTSWKGHKKNNKACTCRMCKAKRVRAKK